MAPELLGGTDVFERVETHVSRVWLGRQDVFKVKKAVDLGFVDFRDIERRREACEAEVKLNERLAPGTYLGVVPVVRDARGRLRFGGEGKIVDWAVHMRRLPDANRADRMLAHGALSPAHVDAIAERVARFHAEARSDAQTAAFGATQVVAGNVRENFAQTRNAIATCLRPEEAREIEDRQLSFLRDNAGVFARRIAAGRIRDGHGDLRLEHVYFDDDGGVRVLDCIEFADRFRIGDTCSDVAFLSMDLAWHGRVDLGERFLARYARASDDYDLYDLVDFYEGYRAYVRGKIATIRGDAGEARRYFLLALASQRRSLLAPTLIAVGGVIASGKSTIADAIADDASAPVVDADRTRKHMLGVDPTVRLRDPAWSGAYDPALTERVYEEVLRRARVVLASGRPVVVDASFRSRAMRKRAREAAAECGAAFRFVECRASAEVCRERLARREREGGVSDGRLAIFDDFRARFEPVDDVAGEEHVALDTALAIDETRAALRSHVATWPRGMVA